MRMLLSSPYSRQDERLLWSFDMEVGDGFPMRGLTFLANMHEIGRPDDKRLE